MALAAVCCGRPLCFCSDDPDGCGELELDREIRRQYPELSFGPAYTRGDGMKNRYLLWAEWGAWFGIICA